MSFDHFAPLFSVPLLALSLLLAGCVSPEDSSETEASEAVTVYRDAWGVAHVHGRTDRDAAFGMGWVQAEDNYPQLEDNALRALGRAAEVHGEDRLLDDWLAHSLGIPRLARAEYDHYAENDPRVQAILDGYAAGIEAWMAKHPDPERRLAAYEPWYPLAFIRHLYYQRGFLVRGSGLGGDAFEAAFAAAAGLDREQVAGLAPDPLDPAVVQQGSNSWAVTGKKSASGHPLLFINPHLPFFGPSQVYEAHLLSDEGWNFSGYTRFGFPLPYVGFNERVAWASTDNAADLADAYVLTFDDPDDPTAYRFGDDHRSIEEETVVLRVRVEGGEEERRLPIRRSHHGPIVARVDSRPVAVRMAKLEEPGWLAQWYAMTRAGNLEEFEDAVRRLDMLFGNYLYADRDGRVLYVYNAAVPVRDPSFDWSGTLDGSDPRAEWRGFHAYEDLPRVLDPASGWVQNCNGTPFLASAEGDNPDPDDFPPYLVVEGDTPRSVAARRILTSRETFDLDTWARLAWDDHVTEVAGDLAALEEEYERLREADPARAGALAEPIGILRAWDQRASVDSRAMTVYMEWGRTIRVAALDGEDTGDFWRVALLERVLADIESAWGTWQVAWGDLHRLQRVRSLSGDFADLAFDDEAESLPLPGAPSWAGSTLTIWSGVPEDQRRRYAIGGNSYVAVVELGETLRARTLHPFGQSGDTVSDHFFDRAAPFVAGDFQPAPVTLEEVRAAAVRSYSPGSAE